jgi:predicted dehydrogenase
MCATECRFVSDNSPLRLAVIGAGHLGRIHARLAKQLSEATLVAVVDPVEATRQAVAAELNVATYGDYHSILDQFDSAIVATPTQFHHAVVMELLQRRKHVFVEKPIALTSSAAAEMVTTADDLDLVLQVGHVERFNPAWMRIKPQLGVAQFIAARRHAPYTCRSTDVGVVFDLMIHDLDLVLDLVDDELIDVQAVGAPVVGPHEDWAEARLTFANGCVAQFSASRVSPVVVRSLDISGPNGFATVDFGSKTARQLSPSVAIQTGQIDVARMSPEERVEFKDKFFELHLRKEDLPVVDHNAILEEQRDFCRAIQTSETPRVTGRDGWRALAVAEQIVAAIAANPLAPQRRSGNAHKHALRGPHWAPAASRRKAG